MICPYCSVDMEEIELGGKTFCSNCGMTIGESPEPEKVDISIHRISDIESFGLNESSSNPESPPASPPPVTQPNNAPVITLIHPEPITTEATQDKITENSLVNEMIPKQQIGEAAKQNDAAVINNPEAETEKPILDDSEKVRKELMKMMEEPTSEGSFSESKTITPPTTDVLHDLEPNTLISPAESTSKLPDQYNIPMTNNKPDNDSALTSDLKRENQPTPPVTLIDEAGISTPATEKLPTDMPITNEKPFGDINPDLLESIMDSQEISEIKTDSQRDNPPNNIIQPSPSKGVELPSHSKKPDNFEKEIKDIDILGASGVLLDILDDNAIQKNDEQKVMTYKAAETLIDAIPFKQPKESRMFEAIDSKDKEISSENISKTATRSSKNIPKNHKKKEQSNTKDTTQNIKLEEEHETINEIKNGHKTNTMNVLTPEEIMKAFSIKDQTTAKNLETNTDRQENNKNTNNTDDKLPNIESDGAINEKVPDEISYHHVTERVVDVPAENSAESVKKKDIPKKESYNKKDVDLSKFKTPKTNHSALKDYFANIFSSK